MTVSAQCNGGRNDVKLRVEVVVEIFGMTKSARNYYIVAKKIIRLSENAENHAKVVKRIIAQLSFK